MCDLNLFNRVKFLIELASYIRYPVSYNHVGNSSKMSEDTVDRTAALSIAEDGTELATLALS